MDAWPSEVSSIDLSYDTTDTFEEFTVTFQYQWYDIENSNGDTIIGTGREEQFFSTGTVTNWINSAIIAVKELYNGKTVWI